MKPLKPLTKSEYMLFLRHPAWLWLRRFESEKLPAESAQDRYQLEQGNEFEAYAEQRFDGKEQKRQGGWKGKLVRLGFETAAEYQTLPERTEKTIADGAAVISQGRIEVDGLTCIVDILERVEGGSGGEKDSFNLYEIKATTKAKSEHEHDLAFQVHVLEKAGYVIEVVSVIHADSSYIRNGDIDVVALTKVTDITQQVRKRVKRIEKSIDGALSVIASDQCPDLSPSLAGLGSFADWMAIYKTLHPELTADSVYNLASPGVRRIKAFESAGIKTFDDILTNKDIALTKKQQWQISAHAKGTPLVHAQDIKNFIDNLVYPIYFFDYETFSHVIPLTDGVRSYQQVAFQYSLHCLDKDGTLTHTEYLHTTPTNPVEALSISLKEHIGTEGSVLVWYESFEKTRNTEMGKMLPDAQHFYEALNERIVDLMAPFSTGMYVDERFGGSASIKKVLPVIVPELSYKDLEIQEGASAQRMWMQTVFESENESESEIESKTPEQKEQVFKDLITYCTLDTYAMVAILKFLQKTAQ